MSNYIVNTSFHIPENIKDKFIQWISLEFVPAALKEPYFSKPIFCHLLTNVGEGTESYAVHFSTTDLEAAKKWHDNEAGLLMQKFPPESLLFFTTYMEEIGISDVKNCWQHNTRN